MPEHKQLRALLAVSRPLASSALRAYFRARGDSVEQVSPQPVDTFIARVAASNPDVVVLELEGSAEPLGEIRHRFRATPVIVLEPASPQIAFQAAKLGAAEILDMPASDEVLAATLDRVIERIMDSPVEEPHADRSKGNRYHEIIEDFPACSNPRRA